MIITWHPYILFIILIEMGDRFMNIYYDRRWKLYGNLVLSATLKTVIKKINLKFKHHY